MILVVTGTHPQQFNRLLKEVDNLVDRKVIKEEVVMQIGYSDYLPSNAKWYKFIDYENMLKLMKSASVVITHGGIGSVLLSLRFNKTTIVVPRMEKFKEHTNDHQLEIANELAKQGRIIPVYDISKLTQTLEEIKSLKVVKSPQHKEALKMIDKFLKQLV